MSNKYILNHFDNIKKYANVIENRLDDRNITIDAVIKENEIFLTNCKKYNLTYVVFDEKYSIESIQI